jgi:hypothetical protein
MAATLSRLTKIKLYIQVKKLLSIMKCLRVTSFCCCFTVRAGSGISSIANFGISLIFLVLSLGMMNIAGVAIYGLGIVISCLLFMGVRYNGLTISKFFLYVGLATRRRDFFVLSGRF